MTSKLRYLRCGSGYIVRHLRLSMVKPGPKLYNNRFIRRAAGGKYAKRHKPKRITR